MTSLSLARQVDIGTVVFYGSMLVAQTISWTSRAAAALTLLLWTKVFYFLKVRSIIMALFKERIILQRGDIRAKYKRAER